MRIHVKKILRLICLLLLLSNSTQAQQVTVKLQLKWYHQFQFAGFYAAHLKGYYSQEGIDIQILEGSELISPFKTITTGKADFAISDPEILFKSYKRFPLVAAFATLQSTPYGIISLSESNIRRPSDLVGKKLMSYTTQGSNIFKAVMLKEGIPLDKIKILSRNKDSEQLIDGTADAVITHITSQPALLKGMGVNPVVMNFLDYGVNFYGDVVFTSKQFSASSPQTVEAFNRASRRGWEYALKHKHKMADHILTLPGVKQRGLTRQHLLEEANELEKLIAPKFIEIGHLNAARWHHMLSVYQEIGLADKSITLKNLIFEHHEKKDSTWYDILIYSLGISAILITIAIVLNWGLRSRVLLQTSALRKENKERHKAEDRLALAIEAAGLGLWESDLTTHKLHLNLRWVKSQLGYELDSPVQDIAFWESLIHPDDQDGRESATAKLIASKAVFNSVMFRVKTSKGEWYWLLSFRKISQWDENGKPIRITGIHLDINSIKQKELELQELSKDLLKKNEELEKFAYITSHNLRAPVVNLRSLTEMLHDEELPRELEKELNDKIRQSVLQLDNTLNDLVEVVSSKSGLDAAKETLYFHKEMKDTILSIEKQIADSNALIESDFSEVGMVNFPRRYLTSVFINLFTNAIKYRSPDRRLIIRLKSQLKKDFIVLTFTDNGRGINMDKFRNKVFGIYQRFHSNIEGKGLGLYIIKSQIEKMDGKIEVESVENEGTTFRIYFYNRDQRQLL